MHKNILLSQGKNTYSCLSFIFNSTAGTKRKSKKDDDIYEHFLNSWDSVLGFISQS